ncbi:MAG: sialidase family protein, partial [Thermoanaerobaculia bacterium]
DPNDLDHVVAGTVVNGAWVSFDGGKHWTRATGFVSERVNAFNFAISPVDGNTVWAMAIDMGDNDSRHIYLSRDGGATYTAVVDSGPDVTLVNGPVMAAHPTNRDVLYFVFGTFFQGYGTDLFRYDASTRELTKTNIRYSDVNAIAFLRGVMYLGLEVEEIQ